MERVGKIQFFLEAQAGGCSIIELECLWTSIYQSMGD